MKIKILCFLFTIWIGPLALAQEEVVFSEVDSLYREDQIYLGFTYNILTSNVPDISQSGFSGGLKIGFIRDWPLNERRNIALGTGLGWAIDTYGQNLFIGESPVSGESSFQVLDEEMVQYDTNRFATQSIESPLQFRWRTSTFESHAFWRIYTGFRLGYVYHFSSRFVQPGLSVEQTDVPEFNRFRLGTTFTFGYNTFNFHFYYSLNSFFDDDAQIEGEPIDLKTLQMGLMFYIL